MRHVNNLNLGTWPNFEPEDIAAAEAVLRSGKVNYWTGDEGKHFEAEMAKCFGASHAITLANGTVALELALRAAGVGPGHDVIVTPRSYFASTGAVILCGARPVFADVDECSQNLTVETIAAAMTESTRAIVVVHLAGWPCEMPQIVEFANSAGLVVIEDCAQAHGARVNSQPVGTFGDAGVFSFCQDKIITCGGEGGALVTNRSDVWERAWSYKEDGKKYQRAVATSDTVAFRFLRDSVGTNLRMTEMQAAIGRRQLARLPESLQRRRAIAAIYGSVLGGVDAFRLARPPAHLEHAYYRYYGFVRPERLRPEWNRDRILKQVSALGVPCSVGACPEIYQESAIQKLGLAPPAPLKVAGALGETSLALPAHPTLSDENAVAIASCLAQVVREATI